MASSSQFPTTKLHNFDLPEHWGDDSHSVVTRRSRSYKPPSLSQTEAEALEDLRQRAAASDTIVNFRNGMTLPDKNKRPRLVVRIPAVMVNDPIEPRPEYDPRFVVRRGEIGQPPHDLNGLGMDMDNDLDLWKFRLPKSTPNKIRVFTTPPPPPAAQEPPKEKKRGGRLGITIPLTKREIEEDIFALTGCKPTPNPTKYSKRVQRVLDETFPGLSLGCITSDKYKVSGPSKKRRR